MEEFSPAFIALGSNLGDKKKNLELALTLLAKRIGTIEKTSQFYTTPPLTLPGIDATTVPEYLNAVVQCRTRLEPEVLLQELLALEDEMGRTRTPGVRWESRTMDLDLLLVGSQIVQTERLTLPHAEMHRRDFVLEPLAEIAPDVVHPVLGRTVLELFEALRS